MATASLSPLTLAQGASLFGLWGMTFLAVAVFASPATLVDDRARYAAPVACAGAVPGSHSSRWPAFGAIRLSTTPTTFVEGVRLRIVQPNQPQDERFSYAAKANVMAKFMAMSDRATGPQSQGLADVTHLIWPESSFPFFLTREPDAMADIANLLPDGTVLITGAARADEPDKQEEFCADTTPSTSSITTARSCRCTTRFIWCRSANICRFRIFSNGSA